MVEVFKTTVQEPDAAASIITTLQRLFPNQSINFDLEDCDRILRIEGETIDLKQVISILHLEGYGCEPLE
jgi:hypothetical protein